MTTQKGVLYIELFRSLSEV